MRRFPMGRVLLPAFGLAALLLLIPHHTRAWVDGPCMMAEEYQWQHRGWNWLCAEYMLAIDGEDGDAIEGLWW